MHTIGAELPKHPYMDLDTSVVSYTNKEFSDFDLLNADDNISPVVQNITLDSNIGNPLLSYFNHSLYYLFKLIKSESNPIGKTDK